MIASLELFPLKDLLLTTQHASLFLDNTVSKNNNK